MKRTCSGCGAVFELAELKTMVRDKDSLKCQFCDETLISWNGSSFFVIDRVIKRPKKSDTNQNDNKED